MPQKPDKGTPAPVLQDFKVDANLWDFTSSNVIRKCINAGGKVSGLDGIQCSPSSELAVTCGGLLASWQGGEPGAPGERQTFSRATERTGALWTITPFSDICIIVHPNPPAPLYDLNPTRSRKSKSSRQMNHHPKFHGLLRLPNVISTGSVPTASFLLPLRQRAVDNLRFSSGS